MKRKLLLLFAGLLFQISEAQPPIGNPPNCGSSVPYFYIDMTGSPDSIWLSPSNVVRNGLCCGGSNPDRYVYFEILLDANTAMVEVDIFTGAEPPGSGRYKVDCGPEIIAGQPVCIAGPGLHHIVFYKPGGNVNQYYVRAIPKPTFPNDDTLRMGCSMPVEVLGLENGSISWSSIYPGATDDYNSYLSCTDCAIPTYTPGPNAPNYVDYRICGNPIADECGYVAICDTVRLYNFDSLSVTVTPNPASFCSPGSVLLSSTVVGGDTPYQYTWRDPSSSIISTSSTATATTGGTHSLEVRDRFYAPGSCPAVFVPVSVSAVAPPTIDAGLDQTLCPESPSAFLTANYSNATGVIWTGGAGTYNPSNTSPVIIYTPTAGEIASGSVTLTATVTGYGAGCSVADDQVTITFPPPIIVTMLNDTVLCFGDMGTLTPVVTNGTGSLTYAWNTGATSATLNASAGNYCVNVTDDLGCVGSSCANIIAPSALTLIMSSTDVSSDLALDGTATGTPGGGTAPYTYLWNNGQTTQTATGLGYGIYTVTVTDANGCTISSSVVVNKPSCIAFQASVTTSDVTCFGAGDGTASVNILGGGSGNYSYSWSPPIVSVSSSVSGLDAGAYLVTVTDNIFGCLEVVSFVILEPTALTNTMNSTNVTTIGGNDGTATANPLGGTPGYSYLWSTGATTQGITGLVAGTYTVTIIDLNFCSLIDSVKINQPPCDNLMITSTTTSVSCNGGTDGSATAFVLFGNAPFAYLWNTGATTQGISGVAAGTYTVTITDDLNCTAFLNINIIEPSILSAAAAPTNPQCFDTFDGTIELNVVGGTYPYSYQWSNGIMVEDLYNLGAGTFTVTVSDAKGCFTNAQATLTAPLPIDANALVTNITCFNGSDGEIDLTVSGGVLPYFYNWNTGATTEDIVGIDAGTYTVTVTDGNGCVNGTVLQFYVNQPADLITDTVIVDCPIPGASTALVTVVPSGGSGGSFFVSFDNGSTFLPQGDYDAYLPTGNTYQIVVKDSNDCVSSVSSSIYVYPTLVIDSTDFNPCFATAQTTTEITVYVSGGRGGAYQLSFDNGGTYNAYGDYTHDLSPGQTYYIIARDSSGCQSDTLVLAIADSVHVTYTVSNFNGYNISCYNAEDAWIDLTVTGGLQPYTYVWSDASTTQDLGSLKPGFYYVYIYDSNGCKDSLGFNITEPPLLTFSSFNPSIYAGGYNISCNGETDGSIDIQLSGGVPSYTYQWNTGATSEDINNIPAGTYTISVLDQNGCSIDSTITLTEPPVLSITSMVPSLYAGGYNITCNGLTDGSIDLSVSGGTAPITYLWSNAATTEDLSGIGAGTYTVTVTDDNGCTVSSNITLTEPPALTITSAIPSLYAGGFNVSCNGATDGSIDLSVSGGTAPITYLWSNAATTEDLSGIGAGTYTVTVTDDNGCTVSTSVLIREPSPLLITSMIPSVFSGGYNVSCNGATDGTVDLTVSGGVLPYDYLWSNAATTEDLSGIGAGTYTVTVTDDNGCTVSSNITLTEPPVLSITSMVPSLYAGGYNITCNGLSDGSIDLSVSGGVLPYDYLWSNAATTEDLSGIVAGTYTVTVTDDNGCTVSSSITLTEPPVLSITSMVPSLYAGGYNISCSGATDGSVDLTTNGGTAPLTYLWSNAATTEDLSGVAAGTYTVTVTDDNGCTTSSSITLTQPPGLIISSITPSLYAGGYNITCNGATDGSIDLSVSGGTAPITYLWSNAATSEDLSGIGAGTYTVTITDANGCTLSGSVTLNQPPVLTIDNIVPSTFAGGFNISCNGLSDGTADLFVSGGTPSYSYLWSNAATTEDLSGIGAGTYTVTVTDDNGCTVSSSITLTEPPLLQISSMTPSLFAGGYNISCNGATDGFVDMSFTGGVPTYSFVWSNGTFLEDISNVSAGTYTVTVTDDNGCTVSSSITLTEPPVLLISSMIPSLYAGGYNITCNGATDGSIDLTVSGGTPPVGFLWSNAATTEDLSGIGAGTYTVTVTDDNGCTVSSNITLTEPPVLSITSMVPSLYAGGYNITCNGLTDGSIDLSVSGGTAPITYLWSNAATTEDLSGIGAGTYNVTVTDDNGCTVSSSITLTEPPVLSITSMVPSLYAGGYNITCNGLTDGSIDLSVSGGTAPITYLWSNAATTEDLSGIGAGTYTVTVTDDNGCTISSSITLIEPSILIVDSIVSQIYNGGYQISCNGFLDGAVNLFISGGTVSYLFDWNNGAYTSQDISNVPAGSYVVIVTDQNGCTTSASIDLTEPDQLLIPAFALTYNGNWNITCFNASDGFVNLIPSGGTPVYQYNWSNGETTEDLSNVQAGTYTVTVTDENGCIETNSITLLQPDELLVDTLIPSLYNGGVNISCYGLSNGSIDMVFSGGTPGYFFNWSNFETTEDIANLPAGVYSVFVTDLNACTTTSQITLSEPDSILLDATLSSYNGGWNISCNGLSDGSIDLLITGGVPTYSFNWSNGMSTEDLNDLSAGTYTVYVTDDNACMSSLVVMISQPNAYALSAVVNDVLCNGFNNGSIDMEVSGGQPDYSYSWSNGESTQDIFNIGSGSYTVTISDQNGCDTTYVFNVIELSPITSATIEDHVNCFGGSDGSVVITAAGGTSPYSYLWSTGDVTSGISNLVAGMYVYTVMDDNNCSLTDTAYVLQPDSLVLTLTSPIQYSGHNISLYAGNDGTINSSIAGGTPEFTYLWSTGDTTMQIMNLTAGTYSLFIIDANGCTDSASITLTQPMELEMPNAYSPNGDGFNDFFVVHGIEAYPQNVFTVVNRWGNVVYEKKNYNNEWNGNNNNGGLLPDGTYFVVLDINDGDIILKSYVDMRRSK